MQYNNPDGKWSENIPYMIINLEHGKDVYLEIIQLAKKDLSKSKRIINSDLVFSPAQITEYRCAELKDQEISKETK